MLTNGTSTTVAGSTSNKENKIVPDLAELDMHASPSAGVAAAQVAGQRTIILPDMSISIDRRSGQPDLRANKTERRVSGPTYRLGS
jgi:peptide deformylase